jgi:hypothetical protein
MILIIGKSSLANVLVERFGTDQCTVVGRPEYDFSQQADCDRLLENYPAPKIIINTVGGITDDYWNNMIINFVSPGYITLKYADTLTSGHIINIGSASAWWPSWPELPFKRLTYNVSKENLARFNVHVNRIRCDNNKDLNISIVEPGRFQGKMSNWQGMPINDVVDCIDYVIKTKVQQVSVVK